MAVVLLSAIIAGSLFGGGTINGSLTITGNLTVQGSTTSVVNQTTSGTLTVTVANASALAVGRQGATNPAFVVDSSVASQVTGLSIQGKATGAGLAVAVIETGGTNNALTVDAMGTGTITIGGTSTGNVILGAAGKTLTVANSNGAVTVAAGGFTVTAGGATVTAGGLTVSAGGSAITGVSTHTSDAVGNVPLAIQGFSSSQTANLLNILQNSAGNTLFQVSTVSSAATGLSVTSAASGSGITLAVLSTASAEKMIIQAKTSTNKLTLNDTLAAATNPLLQSAATDTITAGVTDGFTGGLEINATISAATAQTVTRWNAINVKNPTLSGAGPAALTDGCVFRFDAAAGTHKCVDAGTTKASPGTVTQWIKCNVAGVVAYVPSYSSKTS